jgi:hypothetical protein
MIAFKEYKSRVVKTDDYIKVIEEARAEQKILASGTLTDYEADYIPFNLEREHFDALIDELRFDEARRALDRMKASYTSDDQHNFIEQYEYRLNLVIKMEKTIQERLIKAEKDFNQHTIFIVSIVVGIVTIFGTANNVFNTSNLSDAILTFKTISFTLVIFIATMFLVNKITK